MYLRFSRSNTHKKPKPSVQGPMKVLIKGKSFTIQRAHTQSVVEEENLQGAAGTKQF